MLNHIPAFINISHATHRFNPAYIHIIYLYIFSDRSVSTIRAELRIYNINKSSSTLHVLAATLMHPCAASFLAPPFSIVLIFHDPADLRSHSSHPTLYKKLRGVKGRETKDARTKKSCRNSYASADHFDWISALALSAARASFVPI